MKSAQPVSNATGSISAAAELNQKFKHPTSQLFFPQPASKSRVLIPRMVRKTQAAGDERRSGSEWREASGQCVPFAPVSTSTPQREIIHIGFIQGINSSTAHKVITQRRKVHFVRRAAPFLLPLWLLSVPPLCSAAGNDSLQPHH